MSWETAWQMWEVLERVALSWTAIILAYRIIAGVLIVGRWTLNKMLNKIGSHGTLTGTAQDQPQ